MGSPTSLLSRRLVTALVTALALGTFAALAPPVAAQAAPPAPAPGPGDAATDPVAAADAEIARLQAEAEALSGRYFDALEQLRAVEARIDDLERRIPVLAAQVSELRARTRERARVAYRRVGRDLAAVIGTGDALDAARRVRWLDRLNAQDDALAEELRSTQARLTTRRYDLAAARAEAEAALDDVRTQGSTIDALLVQARERRHAAATAGAAATTATDGTPGSTSGSGTSGSGTPGPATPGAPAAAPTTPSGPGAPAPTAPASPPAAPPTYSPTPGVHPRHDEPFLVCTRARESSGNYGAYNPEGPYMGAYQFLQSTWNSTANHAGRPDLVGVPPHTASPYDQDELAWALYQWRGSGPWGGHCE